MDPTSGANATVSAFQLNAGYFDNLQSTLLSWYDASGNLIGSQLNSQFGIETFSINSATPIASWNIHEVAPEPFGFAIDNVEFNTPTSNISLDVVDASTLGVEYNQGSVNPSSAANLSSGGTSITNGVTADGAATLLLRLNTFAAGTATFTLAGTGNSHLDGLLFDPLAGGPGQSGSRMANTQPTGATGDQAFTLYQAPIDYTQTSTDNSGQRSVTVTVQFTPSSGQPTTVTRTINIVRPPVVLVHGLWSFPSTWNMLIGLLKGQIPSLMTTTADYHATNASAFAQNSGVVYGSIQQARTIEAGNGYANVRADVVAHSMGGILSRLWVEAPSYLRADNLNLGDIHKLITLDTPYTGAFTADGIVNYEATGSPSKVATFQKIMAATNHSVTAGAVSDLQTTSKDLELMNFNATTVYAFADEGNGTCSLGLGFDVVKALANMFLGFTFPTSPNPNDMIVDVSSQGDGSGLPGSYQQVFPYCHTNIYNQSTVASHIGRLLNSSVSTFSPFFFVQ